VQVALRERADECRERDMLFFNLGSAQSVTSQLHVALAEAQRADLRAEYVGSDAQSIFILIGKDGGEKARQTGELNLQAFFDLIDTMPMRQQEMRDRNP
jgi:hypothetical protein